MPPFLGLPPPPGRAAESTSLFVPPEQAARSAAVPIAPPARSTWRLFTFTYTLDPYQNSDPVILRLGYPYYNHSRKLTQRHTAEKSRHRACDSRTETICSAGKVGLVLQIS
ncbi:hypothetical protein SSCG_02590 [Streptomyces clavuligerus]|nr:hypothetical protein SSCG_02590 [Streptomyces clavuligerus]